MGLAWCDKDSGGVGGGYAPLSNADDALLAIS